MSKKSNTTPSPGGWKTPNFLNVIYNPNEMSSLSTENAKKMAKKGLGIVIFAVAINMIGKYTVRKQPFPVYSASMGARVFVTATAGILATEYAEAGG